MSRVLVLQWSWHCKTNESGAEQTEQIYTNHHHGKKYFFNQNNFINIYTLLACGEDVKRIEIKIPFEIFCSPSPDKKYFNPLNKFSAILKLIDIPASH